MAARRSTPSRSYIRDFCAHGRHRGAIGVALTQLVCDPGEFLTINACGFAGSKMNAVSVGICGDAKASARALNHRLANRDVAARRSAPARLETLKAEKEAWEKELGAWTHETDDWSLEVAKGVDRMHPRQMLRELEKAMPKGAMVSTDIGNICSVSNSYLLFRQPNSMFAAMSFGNCGYAFPTIIGTKVAAPERPAIAYVGDGAWGMSFGELLTCVREDIPVTAVVFNNEQWGAEKKNQVDFYANRFEGVNLKNPGWAEVARTLGAEGVVVKNLATSARPWRRPLPPRRRARPPCWRCW